MKLKMYVVVQNIFKNIIVILFKTGNNLKKKFTNTLIIDFKIMSVVQ